MNHPESKLSGNRETANQINDGLFLHAVIQGRDITLQLPSRIPLALSGLPLGATAFTGRNDHLAELIRSLDPAATGARVLISSVAGLGGIGKTELVLQAAHRALQSDGWFPGGALFVDLFGYDSERRLSPERALSSMLHALGVPGEHVPEELQGRARLYRSILAAYAERGRRILVVIDNASTENQVHPLLPTDGTTAALVTSRHTLDIGARLYDLEALEPNTSVDLLRNLLHQARGGEDERVDDEYEQAHRIAELCGHLPLALHISAAILADSRKRPLTSLVESLESAHNRLDRLRREDRAVQATFDLSYENLREDQRRLFCLLPLNPGPDLSTSAASHLGDISESVAEELLEDLVRAHLVEPGLVWGRWRMHDLVRLYAFDRSAYASEKVDAVIRLLESYLALSTDASGCIPRFDGRPGEKFSSPEAALEWFDAERENLLACTRLGISRYEIELPFRLARYLDERRLYGEWEEMMTIGLAAIRAVNDKEWEGAALDSLGMALRELFRPSEAIACHRAAVEIAREIDHVTGVARYLNNLGLAFFQTREFGLAYEAHLESAREFSKLEDRLGFARATDNSAIALREMGSLETAAVEHEKAIKVFREAGVKDSEARALTHFGSTLVDMSRAAEAIAPHRQAVAIFRELNLSNEAGHALINLCNALRSNADYDDALVTIQEALAIHREVHDLVGLGRALNVAGLVYESMDDIEQAISLWHESLQTLTEVQDETGLSHALGNMGMAYGKLGKFDDALHYLSLAADAFSRTGAPDDEAIARDLMAMFSNIMEMVGANGADEAEGGVDR